MRYFYFLLAAFWLTGMSGTARGQSLHGRVMALRDGRPVSGATVSLNGGAYQSATNALGEFKLSAPAGAYTLRVTYVGMRPYSRSLVLPLRDTLGVELEPAVNALSEVTVSTGYQELPKERATGSFVQVDRKLLERSVSTDVIDRLRDVTPGLSFNSIGTRFSVRGQSTLFSTAEPLIVVDGFPYNQPIEDLNPNDVESITVLKDAAAASIWGSRAGNGVVVIKTKRGAFNAAPRVSVSSNITVGDRPDLFSVPRMSSADYISLERRLFDEHYFDGQESALGHPALSPVVETLIAGRDGAITAGEAEKKIAELAGFDLRGDLLKYLYHPSVKQQYALSLSGGSDVQRYFFSAGADRNTENLSGNSYDRLTLSGNNTWSMAKRKLELSLGLNYTKSNTARNSPGNLTWNRGLPLYPYARLADEAGQGLAVTKDLRQGFVDGAPGLSLLDWNYRPLEELRLSDNTSLLNDIRLNTGLKYRLPLGFSAQLLYQYDRAWVSGRNIFDGGSFFARNLINRYTQDDGSGVLSRAVPLGGILDADNSQSVNHDLRGQLDYNRVFGGKHELSAIAGYEVQSLHVLADGYRQYGYDSGHASFVPVDGVTPFVFYDNPSLTGTVPFGASETDATDHNRSFYANAAYTYDGRYTLSASGRLDQSNLFGVRSNQKGVPLYSAGAAWNISRESFYHSGWLPELKLRASFGYNGNINKNLSAYTTASYFDGSDAFSRQPYARIVNPPNPALSWERIRHINLGVDFGGQVISGSLEYFWKRGMDLIGRTALAPSSGVTNFTGNTASTAGHGFDISLESRNLRGAFAWTTNLIISHVTDKVDDYAQQAAPSNYLINGALGFYPLSGRPLYAVYSYASAGLDPATGDPQGYLNGAVSKDYAAIIASATPQSLVYHGSSRPVTFGSFRNTFSYRNFSLSANITYKLGYVYRRTSVRYGTDYGLSQQSGDYALRWQQPGDEARTVVPSLSAAPDLQRDEFYSYSAALVEKGDHIRLQDVRLSWSLPRYHLEIYAYAANLGILWRANHSHTDPDVPGGYSIPRTVAGGMRLNF